MSWTGSITEDGTNLIAQWSSSQLPLYITQAKGFAGNTEKQSLLCTSNYVIDNKVALKLLLIPDQTLDSAYTLTKIKIYAKLGESGTEIVLCEYTGTQDIPAYSSDREFIFQLTCYTITTQGDFEVTIDGSAFAPTNSPSFTGTPTAPTATAGTNTNQIATTSFVTSAILVETNNRINAINNLNANISQSAGTDGLAINITQTNGVLASVNASLIIDNTPTNNSTYAVQSGAIYNSLSLKANINSPAFTGTPTAITANQSINNTQLATTEFVHQAIDAIPTSVSYITATGLLNSNNWVNNAQTITVNGVTNNSLVIVSPSSFTDAAVWSSSGLWCSNQGTDSLTFTCSESVSSDCSIHVAIWSE